MGFEHCPKTRASRLTPFSLYLLQKGKIEIVTFVPAALPAQYQKNIKPVNQKERREMQNGNIPLQYKNLKRTNLNL